MFTVWRCSKILVSQSGSEQEKTLKDKDFLIQISLKLVFLAISHTLHYLDPQNVLNTERNFDVLQLLTCVGLFYLQWFLSYANF